MLPQYYVATVLSVAAVLCCYSTADYWSIKCSLGIEYYYSIKYYYNIKCGDSIKCCYSIKYLWQYKVEQSLASDVVTVAASSIECLHLD